MKCQNCKIDKMKKLTKKFNYKKGEHECGMYDKMWDWIAKNIKVNTEYGFTLLDTDWEIEITLKRKK